MQTTILTTPDMDDHLTLQVALLVEQYSKGELTPEEATVLGLNRYEELLLRWLRNFGPETLTEHQRVEVVTEALHKFHKGFRFCYIVRREQNGANK